VRILLLLLIFSFLNIATEAKDFGIEGHTYEIIEEDILKFIERKLAQVDLKKLNQEMKTKTTEYVNRPTPVKGITRATESKITYYDPTYILQEDIKDHEGRLIHKAGKRINPLEYLSLGENLIFIDGDDSEQVDLALTLNAVGKTKIILVKGSPIELQRKNKIWVYFDQAGMITRKLGITEVPAFVDQENLKLRIKFIGLDKHE